MQAHSYEDILIHRIIRKSLGAEEMVQQLLLLAPLAELPGL